MNNNIINKVHTITSAVVDTVQSSAVVTSITNNKTYQTVDKYCTDIDKKQEELGTAAAQAVVQFFNNLFK